MSNILLSQAISTNVLPENETSPVVSGDIVYMDASDGVLYALDRKNGQLLWKHAMGAPIFGSVAISGNALIAVDFAGNVYGFTSK